MARAGLLADGRFCARAALAGGAPRPLPLAASSARSFSIACSSEGDENFPCSHWHSEGWLTPDIRTTLAWAPRPSAVMSSCIRFRTSIFPLPLRSPLSRRRGGSCAAAAAAPFVLGRREPFTSSFRGAFGFASSAFGGILPVPLVSPFRGKFRCAAAPLSARASPSYRFAAAASFSK